LSFDVIYLYIFFSLARYISKREQNSRYFLFMPSGRFKERI
jgi:hypothetical protein